MANSVKSRPNRTLRDGSATWLDSVHTVTVTENYAVRCALLRYRHHSCRTLVRESARVR